MKVVLSGAGGDELFGGYPWRYYRGDTGGREAFFGGYYAVWQRLVPDEDKARLFSPDTLRALGDESAFDAFRGSFSGRRADRPDKACERCRGCGDCVPRLNLRRMRA